MMASRARLYTRYIRFICVFLFSTSIFLAWLVFKDISNSYNQPTPKTADIQSTVNHAINNIQFPSSSILNDEKAHKKISVKPPRSTQISLDTSSKHTLNSEQKNLPDITTQQIKKAKPALELSPDSPKNILKGNPKIAIIIDDLGYSETLGEKFIALPYDISYAFIPFSPYASRLAELTHKKNKLVMLHAPMATLNHGHKWEKGLHPDMSNADITAMLNLMLTDIPHVKGVNNHGGSLFTQSSDKMHLVLKALKNKNLFFIDSRTSSLTVGQTIATQLALPFNQRDVFLDNSKDKKDIHLQIDKLIATANKQGYAIGIAHPYMQTYEVFEERLKQLNGIDIVPANALLN